MTALLAATGNPPSLKAIYDFMAPAFFYRNLVYPGGSLNMIGLCGAWLGFMNLTNLFPPFYIKGRPDWRTVWEKRLEAYTPYLVSTSDHITYDDYWKMNDFPVEKITIPTFILEGWWDFARNDGFQIYEKLNCPKKLLIGPWVHTFPSFSELEQMDYMRDMIRWFDYWLKDKDAGIMDEPPFSIYVMGAEQWKYESEWPPERAVEKTWYCHSDGTLGFEADRNENTVNYEHDPAVGTAAGLMIVFPLGLDYPQEQREDNMRSLAFDTAPVDEPVEIVGEPSVQLTVSTDMPDASITVKLCDVDRDGNSTLITSGSLRLSCRDGFEKPVPPEQGKAYTISIPLFHSCYRVCTGNRLRLCLSLSDFPRIFPLPYSGSVTLHFGEGKNQQLSVRALSGEDQPEIYPHFELPDLSILEGQEEPFSELCVQRDEENNRVTVHGAVAYEIPLFHMKKPLNLSYHYDASIVEGKPDTAVIETEGEADFLLDGRRFVCKTRQVVTQNEVEISSSIEEEGSIIFEREFQRELYWI
jgi:predicted acyl esterase